MTGNPDHDSVTPRVDRGVGASDDGAGTGPVRVESTHEVALVTRAGCHLCVEAERSLRSLADELGFAYRELDVDASPALRDAFSDRVPVVLLDGKEHGYWRVEEPRLRRALARPRRS